MHEKVIWRFDHVPDKTHGLSLKYGLVVYEHIRSVVFLKHSPVFSPVGRVRHKAENKVQSHARNVPMIRGELSEVNQVSRKN